MQFKFVATNQIGKRVKGYRVARNSKELLEQLKSEKLYCLKFKEKSTVDFYNSFRPVTLKEISLLCKYFQTSLKAGMNITAIFNLLSYQFKNKHLCTILNKIREEIEGGNKLSDSFNKYPKIFPSFLRKMVLIGEESGKLQEIFISLEKYYQRTHKRNKKILNSLIYPIFLFLITIVISLILMIKVVPSFANQLTSLGGELPSITKFYIFLGKFIGEYGLIIALAFFVVLLVLYYFFKEVFSFSSLKDGLVRVPVIKTIIMKTFYVRFSYSLFLLLSSGNDIIIAINTLINGNESNFFKSKLENTVTIIEKGGSIYLALSSTNLFPKFFLAMINIGEENGNLEEMLSTANEIFEEELTSFLEMASSLIEPIMILILGVLIGTIVISIMVPLFNLSTIGV